MASKRVLLLGDFIRLSYQPYVEQALGADESLPVVVVGPPTDTGDSARLAATIDAWLTEFRPDAVHFNAGLEDCKWSRPERRNLVSLAEYEVNLQRVVDACKMSVGGDVIFALTTPVIDAKQCDQPGSEFDRFNREIMEYNAAAQQIMLAEDVLIDRIDQLVAEHDDEYLATDGVSLNEMGAQAVGTAVARCIRSLWH